MSSNINNPYNIAGKPVQGGLPADLEFIRFNFANNQWEFVLAAAGESNLGANVGGGVGLVFRDKTGVTLNFKSLIQGTNITITNNADDITIDGPVPGEVNLAANVGVGAGLVFRDKTGVTLNLKSLLAGANITLTNNADDITIAAAAGAVVLWTVLGDYEAIIAEASHNFNFTAVDFDDDSELLLVFDGFSTASFILNLEINGIVTGYFIDGRRISVGTETIIDINNAVGFQIASASVFSSAESSAGIVVHITLSKGTALGKRPTVVSLCNGGTVTINEVEGGTLNSQVASITDINIKTSTSTWGIGTRITLYKLARA